MVKFRKAVLQVGTYKSPDGEVQVTPDRLRHWQAEFNRLRQAKQVIPIDWDHADAAERMQPLSLSDYRKRRSARNTVGHLEDFRLSPDGNRAELVLDVHEPAAQQKAAANSVYVSPVIFPQWQDGHGNQYQDCITHVDFVNHPVDSSQGPFEAVADGAIACAIRMSLDATPYRFAGDNPMADDAKKPDDEEKSVPPESDSEDSADDAAEDAAEGEGEGEAPPQPVPDLGALLQALQAHQIVLPDDTTPDNFLDRLHTALLTSAAHKGLDTTPQAPGAGGNNGTTWAQVVDDSGISAMSLDSPLGRYAAERHKRDVTDRLQKLFDSGRCTPAEFKQRANDLGAVRLSLQNDGTPVSSDLERWIDAREPVPAGTFWTDEQRVRMASVVDPPEGMQGEPTPEAVEKIAAWAMGRKQ